MQQDGLKAENGAGENRKPGKIVHGGNSRSEEMERQSGKARLGILRRASPVSCASSTVQASALLRPMHWQRTAGSRFGHCCIAATDHDLQATVSPIPSARTGVRQLLMRGMKLGRPDSFTTNSYRCLVTAMKERYAAMRLKKTGAGVFQRTSEREGGG